MLHNSRTPRLSKCRNKPAVSIITVPSKVNTEHPADIYSPVISLYHFDVVIFYLHMLIGCFELIICPNTIKLSVPLCAQQNDTDQVPSGPSFVVVVAIDFGTTSSGYAYAFAKEPECIHTMR